MTVEEIKLKIENLRLIMNKLKKKPTSFEDLIIKKYIEFESTTKLSKYLKERGYRTPRGTKYTTYEIRDIIQSRPKNVDNLLKNIANNIFNRNSRIVNNIYG
ncbi:MAG: recombinase family protein [Candidatus Cloacimonetes bacterium]|nr:recombinase family protein [Candidatus Cloacimonadota bacterium]